MHCRCPVISSDCGSLPEIAGEAGVLLNPDDLEGWTSSIRDFTLDEKNKGEIAESKGRAQALSFSWSRAAAETLDLYQSVVNE
jgi:glycosyltransferase involved in cell wall biosynthesis